MRGESRLLELGYALGIAQGLDELQRVLLNPDFYETQHQKPHNKLKKAQIPLRENKLSLELKLGGGSTNPRSKGTPQPPLRRKSIRGAFSYLFSRAPLVFAGCPRVLSSRFLFTFSSSFFLYVFLISTLLPTSIRQTSWLRSRCLSVCLSSMAPLSTFARLFFRLLSSYFYFTSIFWLLLGYPSILFLHVCSRTRELLFHGNGHDLGHVRGLRVRLTLGGLKRHAVDALLVGALGCSLCSST